MKVAKTEFLTVVEHGSTEGHKEGELAMATIRKKFLRRWRWFTIFAVGLIMTLLIALSALAQELVWEQTNGPYRGNVNVLLATLDGRLYAGTGDYGLLGERFGGVFRSDDGGKSWAGGLTNTNTVVWSLAVSGATLYVGTSGIGVLRSDDGGKSWTAVNTGLTNLYVQSLAVSGATLYAGTGGRGAFRSDDGGKSWTAAGLTNTFVRSLAVSGATLYAGTNGSGTFRSDDGGKSWTAVNMGGGSYVGSWAVSGETLYAGTWSGGVFRSDDGGKSWTAVNTGLTNLYVGSLAVSGATLYAGTGGGVFRSDDGGKSWTAAGLTKLGVGSLAVSGTTLYAGTRGGVCRSGDGGKSWTAVNTGLTNTDVQSLAVSGTTLYAGTNGSGVFRSGDGGKSWTAVNTGLTDSNVLSWVVSGATLYAGTWGSGVFRWDDEGKFWTAVNTGLPKTGVQSLAVSGTTLYAGTWSGGVFRSDDGGKSWIAVNTGLTNRAVRSLVVSGAILYAGTWGSGVFRSVDGGASWTAVNTGLTNREVLSLAVFGTTLYAGTGGGGVFRSADGGNSWTAVNTGLTNLYVGSLAVSGTTLYAGTYGGGVFRLEEGGNSWTAVNTGLTKTGVESFAVSGTTLYAGTIGGGVFRASLSGVPPTQTTEWIWPRRSSRLGQGYGAQRDDLKKNENLPPSPTPKDPGDRRGYHTGIDISSTTSNMEVLAAASGYVAAVFQYPTAEPDHGMQGVVILKHELLPEHKRLLGLETVYSLYAHLGKVREDLKKDVFVKVGDVIGNAGGLPDNHLHFELKTEPLRENPVKPLPGVPEWQQLFWGYTPEAPDKYGYRDPLLLLSIIISDKFKAGDHVKTTEELNMRDAQGVEPKSKVISVLPKGSVGQVLDHPDNGKQVDGWFWWRVRFGDKEGWSSEHLLEKIPSPPKLEAQYSFSVQGRTVKFTDTSKNGPTAWSWDFGDKQTSNEQHPTHTYSREGTYTVTLTIRNTSGEESRISTSVTVQSPPWDVNGDGIVDIRDLVLVGSAFGKTGTGISADVNGDGRVDILDIVIVASHLGEQIAAPAAPGVSQMPDTHHTNLIEDWLRKARVADDGSEIFRRGIAVLESLLNAIVPEKTALFPNYPNPFNPETWIPYQLSEGAEVTIAIYDMQGKVVKRLDLGYQPAGIYRERARAVYWDGRNEVGEPVASGIYFVELRTNKFQQTQRIVMLK